MKKNDSGTNNGGRIDDSRVHPASRSWARLARATCALMLLPVGLVGLAPSATLATSATSTILAATGTDPAGIALDRAGNVYTANYMSETVSRISADGSRTETFGPTGESPIGIAVDAAGNVFTANEGSDSVSKISADGVVTETFGQTSMFPTGIAVDSFGNVYTANAGGNNVTKISADGLTTTTIPAGGNPSSVAVDGDGNVYTTNLAADTVTRVSADRLTTETFGPTGSNPSAIVVDGAGSMYVANRDSNSVSKISADGLTIETLGATGDQPTDLALDAAGNAYTANYSSDSVSKVSADGTSSEILAATGRAPFGVAVDRVGSVYTANLGSDDVSKIVPNLPEQTVTFGETPAVEVGGTGTVSATSNAAGAAISFTSTTTGVCTVSTDTGKVTGIGKGDCVIRADGERTATWAQASAILTFTITGAQRSREPGPTGTSTASQIPARSCVVSGSAIQRRGAKKLLKSGCVTNAGQPVGVKVRSAKPRGDVRYYRLFCVGGSGKKTGTAATGFGGFRACAKGKLKIRTYGTPLKLRVTWKAKSATGFKSYKENRVYKL